MLSQTQPATIVMFKTGETLQIRLDCIATKTEVFVSKVWNIIRTYLFVSDNFENLSIDCTFQWNPVGKWNIKKIFFDQLN